MYNYDRRITGKRRRAFSEFSIELGRDSSGFSTGMMMEDLDGHMLILGKSGSGKSTLMLNIIRNMMASGGSNIIILDPHGTLSDAVVSANRGREFVDISPGTFTHHGAERAVSFNTISVEGSTQAAVDRTTGWIRDMLSGEDSISSGVWGPRLEIVFRVILAELIRQDSNATLEDLVSTLTDRKRMKHFISAIANEAAREFLDSQYRDWRNWTQYTASTLNRLLPLITSDSTRHLVSGKEDSADLHRLLVEGNSLMTLNISRADFPPETIRIVTSLFLLKLWGALMKNFRQSGEGARTYIFIDEFQVIPSGIVETLLSEGRKFGVRVILATQFIHTENPDMVKSLMGNIRNFACFTLSHGDAMSIAGMIYHGNRAMELADVMKSQKLHNAVLFSQTSEGLNGPLSFTPPNIASDVDRHEVSKLRFESRLKYSIPVQNAVQEEKERTFHEEMLDEFQAFLQKGGIEMERSVRRGASIADGVFMHEGREYIVEAESSDTAHKERVLSKLSYHRGRKLVLICAAGQGETIHRYIAEPTSYRINRGLALEMPLRNSGSCLYARDVAPTIPHTLIVEYGEKGFSAYWNGGSRRLLMRHLNEPFTFAREMQRDSFAQIRESIMSLMVDAGSYALHKEHINPGEAYNQGYIQDFLDKNTDVESPFIFLKDLFHH